MIGSKVEQARGFPDVPLVRASKLNGSSLGSSDAWMLSDSLAEPQTSLRPGPSVSNALKVRQAGGPSAGLMGCPTCLQGSFQGRGVQRCTGGRELALRSPRNEVGSGRAVPVCLCLELSRREKTEESHVHPPANL